MTIEAGLAVTILVAIVTGTKWISSALAKLAAQMGSVNDKHAAVELRVTKVEDKVNDHGERLASIEAR